MTPVQANGFDIDVHSSLCVYAERIPFSSLALPTINFSLIKIGALGMYRKLR